MQASLRPLMPVAVVFLCLLGALWWGFDTWIEHRRYPNSGLTARAGAPTRIVLEASRGGHYFVPGEINGHRIRFLIDTGASGIGVPGHLAEQLGLERGMRVPVTTAAGTTHAYATRIETIAIGGIRLHNLRGLIIPAMQSDTVLLGMSFLEHVDFRQNNGRFIMRWPK